MNTAGPSKPFTATPFAGTDDLSRNAPSPDELAHSVLESALSFAVSTLQGIQALAAQSPADERAAWKRVLKRQQEVIDFLHQMAGAQALQSPGGLSTEKRRELAKLVRQRRHSAGLTQEQLAEFAGLSTGTIKAVESGSTTPTRTTLMRLLSVKELKLSLAELPLRADTRIDVSSAPTSYLSPTYEPMRMFLDLVGQLNSEGGYIEQTYAYIDPMSAATWYAISTEEGYDQSYRRTMPLETIVRRLTELVGRTGVDVIALGAGDAKQETRLAQLLASELSGASHRLYLVDISHALLTTGYRYATDTLAQLSNVSTYAIHGNFLHLPRYTQLHYTAERAHRRRVLLMLGHTIANLDNEIRFVRHCLSGYGPGDCLLIDVRMAYGSPDKPGEIEARDPALVYGLPARFADWLSGPIHRYVPGVVSISCSQTLDTACAVRGSYALEVMAHVKMSDRRERHYSIFRTRRYDPESLANQLRQLGWELVERIMYGPPQREDIALMLFRKVTASANVH